MVKDLVRKVMLKLASAVLGSFYVIDDKIYYSTIRTGLLHPDLWEIIVKKAFSELDKNKQEILKEYPFGADRGRVTWVGEMDPDYEKPLGKGKYLLEASTGCKDHLDRIKKIFKLDHLKKDELDIHYSNEGSYKIMKEDRDYLENLLKDFKPTLKDMHIANKK